MPAYGSLDTAIAGLLVNGYDFIDSMICGESAGIAFGSPVWAVAGAENSARAYASGRRLRGVAIASQKEAAGSATYKYQDAMGILQIGTVWVYAGAAVNSGAAAYWDAANLYWTSSSTSTVQTPYYFKSTTSAAGLALLDVTKSVAAAAV